MLALGSLAFTTPWLLAGLVVLPALWWLLRVTPPAPKLVRFPAISLLFGLVPREETPAKTPLWLILLRMVLAALLILALAHPLLNPSQHLPGTGPLVLVVDDGWASAPHWTDRQALFAELTDRAEREGRRVLVLPTAPTPAAVAPPDLLRASDAKAVLQTLQPKPWPVDRAGAAQRLDGLKAAGMSLDGAAVLWLADGIDDGAAAAFADRLRAFGSLTYYGDGANGASGEALAHAVLPGPPEAGDLTVTVRRAATGATAPFIVRASGDDGRLIGRETASFAADRRMVDVAIKLPTELRNRVGRVDIEGETSAAASLLIDEQSRRRPVGLASSVPADAAQPLLSDFYYVDRALQPFAEVRRGTPAELIKRSLSLLVLTDGDPGPAADHAAIVSWLESGGVVLRFAGPRLAAASDDLMPVTLRRGDRTIGGALSWEQPARLAPFAQDSPFAGLAIPSDVTVDRQVLAEPSIDLAGKTWARLTDGTPLVTAEHRGKGWLILIHTTANTAWTNLPLSGLFVDMLRRVVQLGQGVGGAGDQALPAFQVMDGFGRLGTPPATVQPVPAGGWATAVADPTHPPGFYGTEEVHRALNLGPSLKRLEPIGALPPSVGRLAYQRAPEVDLRPSLLGGAALLGILDILIAYALSGLLPRRDTRTATRAALGAALLLLAGGTVAHAQALSQAPMLSQAPVPKQVQALGTANLSDVDRFALEATGETRLAYVRTGLPDIDETSRAGLLGLGGVLSRRTAIDTGDPMEVDVEHDELIFFPLLYWPVVPGASPLSPTAVDRVNRYLGSGGTILFDTRDQAEATPGGFGSADASAQRMAGLFAGLKIPPLVPVPPEHVLTKSFYLMQDFPGRWVGGTVWVEPTQDRVNDGVSTVIMGSNDWAGAWAVDAQGRPTLPVIPGGEPQREQAYRFGVNVVMYALTGNYKADQVHVPAILERLGQ
ncbi:MAG TPA: DUF4159 domain-containing protein [Stellaceae bacterium]|nr:DUF4159 domain-containing protein [Stellaceae bacterium]